MHNMSEYAERRKRFFKEMGEGSIGILAAAPERLRSGDCDYPYRQNSDFYYLTGFPEPESVAVFIPGRAEGEFILFNRERNPSEEVWLGPRAGQEGAVKTYGADQSFPISELDNMLPKLLENKERVYHAGARDPLFNQRVIGWVSEVQTKVRGGINAPKEFINIELILHEMRLRKRPAELALMRKAGEISAAAHRRAMEACRPGMMEYELEAELQYVFTKNGSRSAAYNHIVGAGANACVLHYNANNAKIHDGDLVLIDAGCEYEYYASDITRTFPANGRFTEAQRAIYEIVLAAQMATIEVIRPGLPWNDLQLTSDRIVTEGLLKIGLLEGKMDQLMATRACGRFYIHRSGHWLGLDTHDVGPYKIKGEWRQLEPGMVFTVEPGIYIPAHSEGVDKKWWDIGVRIEDDVTVTKNGCEVLTASVPKKVDEIEALMAAGK